MSDETQEEFAEFIKTSREFQVNTLKFQASTLEFQSGIKQTLFEMSTLLKQIPLLSERVLKLEEKSVALELAEKDKEIADIKQKAEEKDAIFTAIRETENACFSRASSIETSLEGKLDSLAIDYRAFKNRLIGYAIAAGIGAGSGAHLIMRLIG